MNINENHILGIKHALTSHDKILNNFGDVIRNVTDMQRNIIDMQKNTIIQNGGNPTNTKLTIDYIMYGIIILLFIFGVYMCFKKQ